jgi:spore germination protein YaaH
MRNNKQYSIIQDEFNQTYFEKELHYKKENTIQIIWYQDSEVTLKRVELSETYGINKIVFWRLGGEDPGIYKFEN